MDRDAVRLRGAFYRACLQLTSAPGGAVGLRKDGDQVHISPYQRLEGWVMSLLPIWLQDLSVSL